MLPKKNRILRKDFPAHNKQGLRVFSSLFSATIYPNRDEDSLRVLAVSSATGPNKDGAKISVVVSKKTAKTATARNYLRRVFYEAVSEYTKVFLKGALIVFYPKIDAQKAKFSVLKTEIEKALRQANLLWVGIKD